MSVYYFLTHGEVVFIDNFEGAVEALRYRDQCLPNATVAVKVKENYL